MIGTLWNNIAQRIQILINSGDQSSQHQAVEASTVYNRGELVGILLETLTKNAAPGSAKNLRVYYAFANRDNISPAELLTAAAYQDCALDTGGDGTRRVYALPINYQGGHWLHIWFTADTFTNASCQLELSLTVLAKTKN